MRSYQERVEVAELEEQELERDAQHDDAERYGFGICARACDSPCGPDGGCVAGRGRRPRREP